MNLPSLHLVDSQGAILSPRIREAVELAFRWVKRDYPQIDTAMIANWAEEIGSSMQSFQTSLEFPDRYAYAALKGKVSDWLRTKVANEEVVGIGLDLERIGGVRASFQAAADRRILFEQLKLSLNERDRYILMLLLDDETSPATVAKALHMKYFAAAKAIERVKARMKAALAKSQKRPEKSAGPVRFCETKG
jgi:hypothetical protein